MKAPGGLEDHAFDTVLEQPVAQGAAAHLGVVEAALVAAVEVRLADIDAGDAEGGGGVISAFLSFCNPGLYSCFRSGRAGIVAAGRPSSRTGLGARGQRGPTRRRGGGEGSATCRWDGLRPQRHTGERDRDCRGHPSRRPSSNIQGAAWAGTVAERPVVPGKPGNAGGGKGPQFEMNAGKAARIVGTGESL